MRFYPKLSPALLILPALVCLFSFEVFFAHTHSSTPLISLVVYSALLLLTGTIYRFSFWTLLPDGLQERRLFATRVVPYAEIVRVGPATYASRPERAIAGALRIDLARSTPAFSLQSDAFDRATMRLTPAHPEAFLTALRHAAPQALFEIN